MFSKMFSKSILAAAMTVGFTGIAAVAQSNPLDQQYPQQGQQQYSQQGQQQQAPAAGSLVSGAQMQRSQFYNFALAPSFKNVNESANEIFIASTDLKAMYGLMGWRGLRTVSNMQGLTQLCFKCLTGDAGMQNFRVVGSQPVKPAPGFGQAICYTFTYQLNGSQQTFTGAAVVHGGSMGNGLITGAMQFFATTSQQYQQMQPELARLAMSIGGSSPQTFSTNANTRASRPAAAAPAGGSTPVANNGIGDWHPYNADASNDRNSRHQQEYMLGFDTVHDDNGTTYQADWSQYNKTAGGYVDPNDTTKVLSAGPSSDPE